MPVEDYDRAGPSLARQAATVVRPTLVVILAAMTAQRPFAAAEPPSASQESAAPTEATRDEREKLRYAGRRFDDWRDQLLHDLDSKTCLQAMAAILAFGRRGYEEESIAALTKMVHDDRFDVAMEATQTLGQIGGNAVAALIDGLADQRPQVRMRAAQSVGRLGPNARTAVAPLANLLNDPQEAVRASVARALVMVAADDGALHPVFERLSAGDDVLVRRALVEGLQANPPHDGPLLRLLIRAVDDEDGSVRSTAALAIAECAPPNQPVIDALKRHLRESDTRTWQSMLNTLGTPGNSATKVAVLADVVTSSDELAHVKQQGHLMRAISLLGGAREQAEVAVPALTAVVEGKVANLDDPASVSMAIDALGRIGPAAKRAIPALERWIFDEDQSVLGNGDTLEKHARLALRKIVPANDETRDAESRRTE
ncbi:MAG TPA: HEAT repeat domain-containing protein [Pirellulales bacterium]|nr:HEAT repeat domain-containing protein [Pirellulales bacterium]